MKKFFLPIIAISVLLCSACSGKKNESKDIIVPPIKKETPKGPQSMTQTRQQRDVQWLGNTYKVIITRQVDKTLPTIEDETGQKYYDNTIQLCIKRTDGSDVINRTFKKIDFTSHISDTEFAKKGALLGIVFDSDRSTEDSQHLYFATSIGSPDVRSDEFIPLVLIIDRNGNISIKLDNTMDTGNNDPNNKPDRNGITGDEEA